MWAIDSSRAKAALGAGWILFAAVNAVLTFVWAGAETIPYHLIWASFAFVYGLVAYTAAVTWTTFAVITLVTGTSLVWHASAGIIDWTECSEIVLMGVILALLIWHVNRHRAAQIRLVAVQDQERARAHRREMAARCGSHEMRTRLTIARGFVELIGQAAEDDGIRSDAQLVIGELDKTTTLATNLLTLVRVHQGGRLAPLDIDDLVEAVVHRWRTTADRDWRVSSSVGTFSGDAERLEVALDCLLENAVKFTGIGDTIAVEARRSGGEIILTVTDAGWGSRPTNCTASSTSSTPAALPGTERAVVSV